MPTYVYACKACEDRFEIIQKMSDASLTTCEKCGGTIRRVIFPPAVVYKGSGFYITDYKNGGRKSEEKSESKSEGESSSSDTASKSSETKTETKAESKSETKTAAKTETSS